MTEYMTAHDCVPREMIESHENVIAAVLDPTVTGAQWRAIWTEFLAENHITSAAEIAEAERDVMRAAGRYLS